MSNKLKTLRVMRGYTLTKVAEDLGISKQRYQSIEENGLSARNEELSRAIADYFGVSVFEILGADNLKIKPRDEKEFALAKKYAFQR